MFELVTVLFIIVHAPDGQDVQLNIAEISSIRKPRSSDGHFAPGAKCIITMGNGKFHLTTEACIDVIHKIAEANKE